jgi:hypothetical protein
MTNNNKEAASTSNNLRAPKIGFIKYPNEIIIFVVVSKSLREGFYKQESLL